MNKHVRQGVLRKVNAILPVEEKRYIAGFDFREVNALHQLKRPHLIIAPNGVVHQIRQELSLWMSPGAVDILVYTGGQTAAKFWGQEGPYRRSNHFKSGDLHHIIIVTSHVVSLPVPLPSPVFQRTDSVFPLFEAIRGHALKYFESSTSKGRVRELPKAKTGVDKRTSNDRHVFEEHFAVVILDEAQEVRNQTPSFAPICQTALLTLLLTATPLHTGPTDLYNLGCMVGHPDMLSERTWTLLKESLRAIAAAKKDATPLEVEDDLERVAREVEAPQAEDNVANAGDDNPRSEAMVKIDRLNLDLVRNLSDCLPLLIRRSDKSVDNTGNLINPLPPLHEQYKMLTMTAEELSIIRDVSAEEAARYLFLQ